MKYFIKTAILLSLTGCTILPPAYDGNEFKIMAEINTDIKSLNTRCSDVGVVSKYLSSLDQKTLLWTSYTEFLPNHKQLHEISTIINNDIEEFKSNYSKPEQPSTEYCEIKSNLLIEKMKRALIAYGKLKWTS